MTAPLRILVVEDDAQLLGYLACLLAGWGYQIDPARSATDALTCCDRQCPDVVITDLVLPGMGGLELLQAVRAIPGCRIFSVLITGHGNVSTAVRAITEGADEVMVKPLREKELLAVLQRFEAKRLERSELAGGAS
jgi:two-component system C4-dicarboxylate transport response regulator DctD